MAYNPEIKKQGATKMIKLIKEIEKVTKGERFISLEELVELNETAYLFIENCGLSGDNKGTLYTIYAMDEEGYKTNIELAEVVV